MNVLITGGAGFVGANLATHLVQQNHQVTTLDNLVRRGSEFNLPRLKDAGVTFQHGDVRCPEDWPRGNFDVVLDTAAQPSAIDGYDRPMYDLTNNLQATFHVLEYCRKTDTGLIFWSSNKVYPQKMVHQYAAAPAMQDIGIDGRNVPFLPVPEHCPLDGGDRSLYGATKLAADVLIQEYIGAFDLKAIINRFSCLAGSWQWGKTEQGWVTWWVIAHQFGLPLTYIGYEGKQTRDVLFIDDLCRLIDRQIERLFDPSLPYRVFNVGGGMANLLSLRQATQLCQEITDQIVPITALDEPRRADFMAYASRIDRVCQAFDWTPQIDVRTGLSQINDWVVHHLRELCHVAGIAPTGTT